MTMTLWKEQAKQWIFSAGEHIRKTLHVQLTINQKSDRNDLVTNIDNEVEQFFKTEIDKIPHHRLLGEEGHFLKDLSGYVWILDPIDGTMNFVMSKQNFAISLALYHNGKPLFGIVYDVMRNEMYHATLGEGIYYNDQSLQKINPQLDIADGFILCDFKEIDRLPAIRPLILNSRGHRRYGSAALEIVYVALGQAVAFLHLCVSPWDIAAAKIIAEEAGAICTRLDGCTVNILDKGSLLVGSPPAHDKILKSCFY